MEKNIIALKVRDNEVRFLSEIFKQPSISRKLQGKLNWLCSMDILNALPEGKPSDLTEYLQSIRSKYLDDDFTVKQIDSVINF